MADIAETLLVVGRLLLGGTFVYGGVHHFFTLRPLAEVMGARGVPMPMAVLIVGALFQAALGLMLVFNVFVTEAALGLVVFTIVATLIFLNFWDMEGEMREPVKNNALSNLAIVGGLLVLAAGAA